MQWLNLILIGIIQGITEFMPISSSAHTSLADHFLGETRLFEFYVLINIGTLGALIWFNRYIFLAMLRRPLKETQALLAKILVSILPAGLLGFFLIDLFAWLNQNLYLTASMLIIFGIWMVFQPPRPKGKPLELKDMPWRNVVLISLSQSLALVSGVSRAGVTILTGMWSGLKQDLAVRWSFLIAIPLLSGALGRVLISSSGLDFLSRNFDLIIVANLVSFIVGLLAISFFLKILKRSSLRPFGVYRIGLGLFLIVLLAANVL